MTAKYQTLDKGNILGEIERLKNLSAHHGKINKIIAQDPYKRTGAKLGSLDMLEKYKSLQPKPSQYRKDYKKFELNKQNVKILQRIVDARQVNQKSRERILSGIRRDESRSRS